MSRLSILLTRISIFLGVFVFSSCVTRKIEHRQLVEKAASAPPTARFSYKGSDEKWHRLEYQAQSIPTLFPILTLLDFEYQLKTRRKSFRIPRSEVEVMEEFPATRDRKQWRHYYPGNPLLQVDAQGFFEVFNINRDSAQTVE
ncbi:MAG: hypothetical protein AAF236_10800 [Verrucomicrobiota bacterium]